ncbi:helix-turn-helix domain-containing protein [Paracoccus mutanolyticus]|uniref:hypothetical protein n=1 Tax=Paracoccus mutanolyticus TaxID=1499308 RepID=UPI001CB99BEA|nr:hypothetical protein [Paracoccus mutanolyticus]
MALGLPDREIARRRGMSERTVQNRLLSLCANLAVELPRPGSFRACHDGYAAGGPRAGVLHGLKIVAVAIVAQAVWGMAGAFVKRPIAIVAVLLALPGRRE